MLHRLGSISAIWPKIMGFLITFCAVLVLSPRYRTDATADVDVAIVGGGLAGLAAAKDLVAAGKSVIVLEARGRVGGRVLNAKLPNGGVTEVGAEFIGPTQDRVIALASSLGLSRYDTYNKGSNVLWQTDTRSTYPSDGVTGAVPPVNLPSLQQVGLAQGQLDAWAQEINVSAPWTHSKALEWDSQTFASWLDNVTTLPAARFLLDVATTSIFSAESSELSLLYVIAYIASAGNETIAGTLERLTQTANGAQATRVNGGTQLLATKLAERLGPSRIVLNTPVRCIRKIAGGAYIVQADDFTVKASKVVVAMSPPLAARIIYDPLLPASRDQLTQRMPMGALGKAIAIYKTPFWRDDGLTGQVVSDSGVVRTTFDSSPADASYGAMMGFIEADEMRAFDEKSEDDIKDAVLKDYIRYFGPKAATPTSWVIQRWDNEEFSRGGPVALAPPRVLTQYGPALTKPFEGIHFAGTESAEYWTGYMDGAIRSGERVAREIIEAK